jgi:hypothetical protein
VIYLNFRNGTKNMRNEKAKLNEEKHSNQKQRAPKIKESSQTEPPPATPPKRGTKK